MNTTVSKAELEYSTMANSSIRPFSEDSFAAAYCLHLSLNSLCHGRCMSILDIIIKDDGEARTHAFRLYLAWNESHYLMRLELRLYIMHSCFGLFSNY